MRVGLDDGDGGRGEGGGGGEGRLLPCFRRSRVGVSTGGRGKGRVAGTRICHTTMTTCIQKRAVHHLNRKKEKEELLEMESRTL